MRQLPIEFTTTNNLKKHLGLKSGEFESIKNHQMTHYKTIIVPKTAGGQRTLFSPNRQLKYFQKRLLASFEKIYVPKKPVQGFVKKRGAISNATHHANKNYILNVDLKEYFKVISNKRIYGLFRKIGFSHSVAEMLCFLCMIRDQLPQGAPTSPILANMTTLRMDRELMEFAKTHHLKYTRYADDITFSSYVSPRNLFRGEVPKYGKIHPSYLSEKFCNIISSNGFLINDDKTWYAGPSSKHEVTGLVVNQFVNVKRTYVRNIRAVLFKIEKDGMSSANAEFQSKYKTKSTLENSTRGKIEWIAQVRGKNWSTYRTLAKKFNELATGDKLPIEPTFADILDKSIWVVEFALDTNQGATVGQGTAFFLRGYGLVTAYHVIEDLPVGEKIDVFLPNSPSNSFKATVTDQKCETRDIVILDHNIPQSAFLHLDGATSENLPKSTNIKALGYPEYAPGEERTDRVGQVTSNIVKHGIQKFSVDCSLDSGMSGGPIILPETNEVVGIIHSGGVGEAKQQAIKIGEIFKLVEAESKK